MKNRVSFGAVWGLATSASLLLLGAGIAAADDIPDVIGQPYYKAKGAISDAKMKAVVSTVVGDRLPQEQCHVMGITKKTFLDSSGEAEKKPTVYVDLNCYKSQADESQPGFSAGDFGSSAEAVRIMDKEAAKEWLQGPKGEAYCEKRYKEHPDWPPNADDCALYYPELVEKYSEAAG